jgi:hypothetical protein
VLGEKVGIVGHPDLFPQLDLGIVEDVLVAPHPHLSSGLQVDIYPDPKIESF